MEPLSSLDNRVSSLVALFQAGPSQYVDVAVSLFSKLAVIEIAFFGLLIALGRGRMMSETFMQIMKMGVFFWFIKEFPTFQTTILSGFQWSGLQLTGQGGGTESLLASSYLTAATNVVGQIFDCAAELSFFTDFVTLVWLLMIGVIVFFAMVFMGLTAVLTIIEYYIVTAIGFIILPFSAFSATRFIAEKTFSSFIALGVKAATIVVVSGFVLSDITQLTSSSLCSADTSFGDQLGMTPLLFATAVLYLLLFINVPGLAAGVLTGSPKLGAGMALVAGAGMLATAGAVAYGAFKGGSAAASAARSGINKASDSLGAAGYASNVQTPGQGLRSPAPKRPADTSTASSGSTAASSDEGTARTFVRDSVGTARKVERHRRRIQKLDDDQES
ncbi:type IV secretion system protein [Nisaea sediminum]|jgi:type IV secretion system protein TrbL|uniref:type IV secretion system protein n=3 Tax=Pseudomonadota TaxID=1224 RepID=UPI001867D830|nr:type IV secretion system protein [Nisaea sediminum]